MKGALRWHCFTNGCAFVIEQFVCNDYLIQLIITRYLSVEKISAKRRPVKILEVTFSQGYA